MAQLAIKGHATRGSEVIALLEMLGGVNSNNLYGDKGYAYYIVDSDKEIKGGSYVFGDELLCHLTLEEFEEKFPYKVGDKVTHNIGKLMNVVVKIYWDIECNVVRYDIQPSVDNNYEFKAMLAEHLQPYKEETMEDKGTLVQIDLTRESRIADEVEVILGDYEFVLKDGRTYFVKKSKYPKTYEECCEVLGHVTIDEISGYKAMLLENLQMLLICRDAYWKIVGEQMDLGKPWKPDFTDDNEERYSIYTALNKVTRDFCGVGDVNTILAFPTEEMRDAFYDNFEGLIEACKELL